MHYMHYDFLRDPVRRVVELLVAKRYDEIVRLTDGKRFDKEMIEAAVTDYGRDLVIPPSAVYDRMDVVGVCNAHPPQWSVRCELWSQQEGRSDLTLELSITKHGDSYMIQLDDIHVL